MCACVCGKVYFRIFYKFISTSTKYGFDWKILAIFMRTISTFYYLIMYKCKYVSRWSLTVGLLLLLFLFSRWSSYLAKNLHQLSAYNSLWWWWWRLYWIQTSCWTSKYKQHVAKSNELRIQASINFGTFFCLSGCAKHHQPKIKSHSNFSRN